MSPITTDKQQKRITFLKSCVTAVFVLTAALFFFIKHTANDPSLFSITTVLFAANTLLISCTCYEIIKLKEVSKHKWWMIVELLFNIAAIYISYIYYKGIL